MLYCTLAAVLLVTAVCVRNEDELLATWGLADQSAPVGRLFVYRLVPDSAPSPAVQAVSNIPPQCTGRLFVNA